MLTVSIPTSGHAAEAVELKIEQPRRVVEGVAADGGDDWA